MTNVIDLPVNAEGYLVDYNAWTREWANEVAQTNGITLTDKHWAIVKFLREDYAIMGETATLRRVSTQTGTAVKDLFTLFPVKPAKKMAYVSGLPKPKGCV